MQLTNAREPGRGRLQYLSTSAARVRAHRLRRQMRSGRRSVAGRPDVSNHLSAGNMHPLMKPAGIALQMGVVVTVRALLVELVDSIAARLA
jgi:hypothetical protein